MQNQYYNLLSFRIINTAIKKMDQYLKEAVINQKSELIDKYIKDCLGNDQKNLQRIYEQLKDYKVVKIKDEARTEKEIDNKKNTRVRKSKSAVNLKKAQFNNITQSSVAKSKKLMLLLRDQGLNPSRNKIVSDSHKDIDSQKQLIKDGVQIYQKQCNKLMQSSQANMQGNIIHAGNQNEAKIKGTIYKYQMNKKLYDQKYEKGELRGLSPDIIQFMQKKNQLNGQIIHNNQNTRFNIKQSTRYINVRSRINSAGAFPLQLKESKRKQSRMSTGNLKEKIRQPFTQDILCKVERILEDSKQPDTLGLKQNLLSCSKKSIAKIPIRSVYSALQQTVKMFQNQNEDIDLQMKRNVNKQFQSNYYDRYNMDYINMLHKKGPKQAMNKYSKDLFKDANRMRKLLSYLQ